MNAIRVPGIRQSTWIAAAVAATVAVGAGAAGIAAATGLGDDETTLTDTELARASRAALTEVGPATVTDAQRGPAESHALSESYTVDTRLPNGVEVAVQLDETFTVVWVSAPSWSGDAASVAEPRVLTAAELASVDRTTAGQAALAEVGSGTVTDFRRSRALDHAFEVEVTLDDGTQRVVELTERSQVVSANRPTPR
ncbi:hypothetical protein E3T34_03135 [Cryobacterium sp. TMT1-62]|uniref:PepSY domain-containing protein n=1 Tax=unclassified Cryobacterium TaxID=2649013 RepID=UPI00106BDED1|nr:MULTISPECIES: hypothetical protein [unclassified Cryobacterium]TFC34560.1 hypothetical protein E3O28_11895 [Cryobacterium sp. TMT2-14]TFD35323.1 hypothetical protein E3T34_03135 [Cryobacterium sp. TMT1-62]